MTFFLTEWFYYLLQWLFRLFSNNYFLTILAVTLILRAIQIYPDIKNRKMQIKTAQIQPEIDELKSRYGNDPQKMQQEQAKIMKKNGISMWSSCLPLLLTLPLFFCFLEAFRCWGNESTITLMYETAVAESYEEGTEEREAAEQQAMDRFNSFKFLWVRNIWQPDSFIDGNFLIVNFDGVVIPKATTVTNLASKVLANMPLMKNGYTDGSGKHIEGSEIWHTLVNSGLASGAYLDAGNTDGCNSCACMSCATDKSGMHLLPGEVDPAIANKFLGTVIEGSALPTDADTTIEPTTDSTVEATVEPTNEINATTAPAEGEGDTVSGAEIYDSIMKRYPDSVSKDGATPANGFLILPVLAAGMQFITMFLTQHRSKKRSAGQQNQNNKSMNMMMYLMPVISIMVCVSSTTAFAFYWTVSGLIQLISTIIINAVFDKQSKSNEVAKA